MNELETKTLPDGSRIERVRELVDEILLNMSDPTERRCAYLHLYGVAQACALSYFPVPPPCRPFTTASPISEVR